MRKYTLINPLSVRETAKRDSGKDKVVYLLHHFGSECSVVLAPSTVSWNVSINNTGRAGKGRDPRLKLGSRFMTFCENTLQIRP